MTAALVGRRALITGGAGGIGAAISEAYVAAGADVVIMSRSEAGSRLAEQLNERYAQGSGGQSPTGRADAVMADVAISEQRDRGFAEAVARLGGLDVLVTCHGAVAVGDALDLAADQWQRVVEVNLTATFALCQAAARQMLDDTNVAEPGDGQPAGDGGHCRGKIITVASMYAFFGGVKVAAYTASKGGVAQLTKALANEWAGRGINVNCLAPGYVRTELNRHVWQDPVRSAEIVARLPAGRWAEPQDLAGPAVFLASPAADYLHGVVLPVDGGFLVR